MLDLLIALLLLTGPAVAAALGIRDALTGAVMAASLLTWPGYALGVWLWPRQAALSLGQRLALAPLLSLLVCALVATGCWFAAPRLTLETVYWAMVGAMAVLALGAALARRRLGEAGRPTLPHLAGASVIFAGMASLAALTGLGPQAPAERLALALYLDPAAPVAYDGSTGSWMVPLVVAGGEEAALELHAARFARTLAVQQVALAPGEQARRVTLAIPAAALPPGHEAAVTVSLRTPGAEEPLRALRVRLRPVEAGEGTGP